MKKGEIRLGNEFSPRQKQRRCEEVGHRCELCGRYIDPTQAQKGRDIPPVSRFEYHHEPAIYRGGGRKPDALPTKMRVLCGPKGCHKIADNLERLGFELTDVIGLLGPLPLAQEQKRLVTGQRKKVQAELLTRIAYALQANMAQRVHTGRVRAVA